MRHRLFRSLTLTALAIVLAGSGLAGLLSTVSPPAAYADVGNNSLLLIGKYCHDIPDITQNEPGGKCHNDVTDGAGWQEIESLALGCSNSMFYAYDKPTDPHDPSVTTKLWYTKQADYKDCYNKAQAMYNRMSDPNGSCALTRDGSPNNKTCVGYQNSLRAALGCDSKMFQRANGNGQPDSNGNYWIIKPAASADCQSRINDVGNVHIVIIGSNGQPIRNPLAINDSSVSATDSSNGNGGGGGGGNDNSSNLGCDANSNPLTWILCPVINDVLVPLINWIDGLITDQLTVPTGKIFCDSGTVTDTCNAYYAAWQSFRDIALGLIVVAGLFMVISQSLGMEILDAYTIRKILPRLLIVVIGVVLSWPLMKFLIILSNDLGFGVRHLIEEPFKRLAPTIKIDFGSTAANLFFGGGATAGILVAGIASAGFALIGGLGAVLAYAATAALAVLVAILVLILRQVVIILLMLLSPVAIVAYVLPNTQRIYKLWWESFSKALLMFPIIVGLVAAGRIFAGIAIHSGGMINGLIGFIAYFAPYFMIPLTFRMAGQTMGAFGNFVQSRASRGFEGLNKFRANRRAAGRERIRRGNLFRNAPADSWRGRLNRGYQTAGLANPDEFRANPLSWRQTARALRERANLANTMKDMEENPAFAPIKGDDDTLQAALYGRGTREDARRYLEAKKFNPYEVDQKLAHIDLARRQMGDSAFRNAAVLSAISASTAYAEDPITGEHEGIGKMLSDLAMASDGNPQILAQSVGRAKQIAQQSGRMDLSAPFSDMYTQARSIGSAHTNAERREAIRKANDYLTDTIVDVEGPGYVLGGKGRAVENLMPALKRRITNSMEMIDDLSSGVPARIAKHAVKNKEGEFVRDRTAGEAQRIMQQQLASTAGLLDVASQVSPEKAKLLAEGVMSMQVRTSDGRMVTVNQAIDALRGNESFKEMRREYERSIQSQYAAAQRAAQEAAEHAGQVQQGPPPGLAT